MATTGFATRIHASGGGFDYLLPQNSTSDAQRYHERRLQGFVNFCVTEIHRAAFRRTADGEEPAVTKEIVDEGIAAVMNYSRSGIRLSEERDPLAQTPGFAYRPPEYASASVVHYFERCIQLIVAEWSTEAERAANVAAGYSGGTPLVTDHSVDMGFTAMVSSRCDATRAGRASEPPTQSSVEATEPAAEGPEAVTGSGRFIFWWTLSWVLLTVGGFVVAVPFDVLSAGWRATALIGATVSFGLGVGARVLAGYVRRKG